MSSIVKEFYENQIDMRGPGDPYAAPAVVSTVCVLRFDDNTRLDAEKISLLFNEIVKDFGAIAGAKITLEKDHVQVAAKPKTGAYKKKAPRIVGFRG